LKINPKAVVPALVVDSKVLTESTIIVEYLDDRFPDPPLKPSDPFARAEMRLFPKACDEGLHAGIGMLSYTAMFMDRVREKRGDDINKGFARIIELERRDRRIAGSQLGMEAPHVYRGIVAFEKTFQKLAKVLSDERRWLLGNQFTLAEINLVPYLVRLEHMGLLAVWTSERPQVVDWIKRIQDRASYKTEIAGRIGADELQEMTAGGARIKARVAELRAHYLATDFGAPYY
jgi:glutathione S-transferase